jgi:hypothetical protein
MNLLDFNKYAKQLNNQTFTDYYNRLQLLARSVFKWNNLPNGISEKWIEKYLFFEGRCMFFKDPELGFMVTKCTDGGMINFYDEPTLLRPVATNYENITKSYKNGSECVLICNNDDKIPTIGTIKQYAYRLADISRTIDINIQAQKTPVLITCTKNQLESLKNVYRQWNGYEPVIYGSKDLDLSGVQVLKTDAPIVFDKLQIQKHDIWNEVMTFLGINNANMDKRDRLVDDEVQANNQQIEYCGQLMLKAREEACKQINEIFKTNISVELRNPGIDDMVQDDLVKESEVS